MQGRSFVWIAVFALLMAFAVPWFLWGTSSVVAGLPVWIWWHVGWMILTAGTFYWFTRSDWGLWMAPTTERIPEEEP